jgi:hypothetical protein
MVSGIANSGAPGMIARPWALQNAITSAQLAEITARHNAVPTERG